MIKSIESVGRTFWLTLACLAIFSFTSVGPIVWAGESGEIPENVRQEITKLQSADPIVRALAAYRLRELRTGPKAAIPYLVILLGDDTPLKWSGGRKTSPGEEAAMALGYEMGMAAWDLVAAVAKTGTGSGRYNAIWTLREIAIRAKADKNREYEDRAPAVVDLLLNALNDRDPNIRMMAGWALGAIHDGRAVSPLISILQNQSLSALKPGFDMAVSPVLGLRSNAASALGRIGDPRAVMPLIAALKDPDPQLRQYAAHALGDLKDPRASEPLIAMLKDKNGYVVSAAVRALGELREGRAVEHLITIFKNAEPFEAYTESKNALKAITGQPFDSPLQWSDWWEKNKQNYMPERARQ